MQSPTSQPPKKWPDGPASAELRQIVTADQDDRQNWEKLTDDERKAMMERDPVRKARVLVLLQENKLITPEDFGNAALVLQHGDTPDDFLLAHELALTKALLRGLPEGLIALAEDRFLEKIGRKQRFGSQLAKQGELWVFGPWDRSGPTAVTDALRQDYLLPGEAMVKKLGYMKAMEQAFPAAIARWEKHSSKRAKTRQIVGESRSEVLKRYRADRLVTPAERSSAAQVLLRKGEPSDAILAHELAVVAAIQGDWLARRVLAEAWDRALVYLGQPQRYGTVRGAKIASSTPPGVRERLLASQKK